MVKAKNCAKIEYRFDDPRAGYARGTVVLTACVGDEYTLYWADDSAAMDSMYPIAVMKLSAGQSGSYIFSKHIALPVGATKLIAVGDGAAPTVADAAAVYEIPPEKRFPYTAQQRSYRFGALSDIHIDLENGGRNTYFSNASKNFARSLIVCAERKADFIISAGDQVTNASGAEAEWAEYRRIIAGSPYKGAVYEAIGNHEMRYTERGGDVLRGTAEFIENTGLDGSADTIARCKPYYEWREPISGDHFIFMALENGYATAASDAFSDEQMDWADGLLKRYNADGHRIFLIQHACISGFGAGDDRDDPAYGGSLNTRFENNARFRRLVETYKDMIWLSGHSHVDFADNVNYSDEDGSACHMIHIPSTAGTTRICRDGRGRFTLDRTFYEENTQGYLVDVYADAVVFCGVNFYDNRLYPAYTYIIGNCLKE